LAVPLKLRLFTTVKFERPIYSMCVADTNGDGKEELIIGSDKGQIFIFKYEKNAFVELWKSSPWMHWVDQIIAADIDNDGVNEIFFITGHHLFIYKYDSPSYQLVWDYETDAIITSICVADSNNNHQKELLLGNSNGLLLVLTLQNELPYNFKQIWKRKLEGEIRVTVGDIDANTLNEIIVAYNNFARVYRVIDKYPKKESWMYEFGNYIKKLYVYDLNSDEKAEIFFIMENGVLRLFSHKDGDYISEDYVFPFNDSISSIASGEIQNKKVVVAGSYDHTIRGFKEAAQLFQIEMEDRVFSTTIGDIDHDGKAEIISSTEKALYIFKEDITLIIQMDYPKSFYADNDLQLKYYIYNNSSSRIYNVNFSKLEWFPDILTLQDTKPIIHTLDKKTITEVILRFRPHEVERVISLSFPSFPITFEKKNQMYSQIVPEIKIKLLPKFSLIAKRVLEHCENLKQTKLPLNSLAHLVEKKLGPIEYKIDEIVSRLMDMNCIIGSLMGRTLYVQETKPLPEEKLPFIKVEAPKEQPSLQQLSPEILLNSISKYLKRQIRTPLPELASHFNLSIKEVTNAITRLKANFEITGVLVPEKTFLYLPNEQFDAIITRIRETPYISLKELSESYRLSEEELEYLIEDLKTMGTLHGEIRTKDEIKRFISLKTLSESLYSALQQKGKLAILGFSRKNHLSASFVREALRSLMDAGRIHGYYNFNGAIFYTETELERQMVQYLQTLKTSSIGITSLAEQFQMSRENISQSLTNILSKKLINGYISENTFFKRSYEEEKLRDLFEKYHDALNIIHILVIHKLSGITVYSESYTTERIDPSLVSGFLQAITSFGSEISGTEHSDLRLLEYQDFKISIQDGPLTRTALILKQEPSQRLLEIQKHFVRFFDTKFQDELQNFKGAIDPFLSTGELVDEFFEISLSFPHEVQEKQVFKNRDRLSAKEFAGINIARGLGRQFQLSTLLERTSKELLISQLEAFSIIYALKAKEIFQVMAERRIWCPHCGSIIPKSSTTCPHCLRDLPPSDERKI